jgi:hypothetical protein
MGTTARLSRRTVVRTGAWAVPVIVIGAPAPAFALSNQPCVTLGPVTGFGAIPNCQSPTSFYVVVVTSSCLVIKDDIQALWVMIESVQSAGAAATLISPSTFQIPGGLYATTLEWSQTGLPSGTLTIGYSVVGLLNSSTTVDLTFPRLC